MPDYIWPPMDKRRVMGKRLNRLDGPDKSTGRAKYNSDLNPKGLLFGVLLTSPHAHARVTSIDIAPAQNLKGVTAVRVIAKAGTEVQWEGQEIAALAAETEEIARDGARLIKVEYEVLAAPGERARSRQSRQPRQARGEQVTGDPDAAFKEADAVIEGQYGIPVITHCCLEPHGQTIQWSGDKLEYFPSTQNVSGIAHRSRQADQCSGHQHSRAHGLHGRRFRQQIPLRPVGRRGRGALQGERRAARQALPRTLHGVGDRGQSARRLRQD